jgi:hypothetical protein
MDARVKPAHDESACWYESDGQRFVVSTIKFRRQPARIFQEHSPSGRVGVDTIQHGADT